MSEVRARPKNYRYRTALRWAGERRGVLSSPGKPDLEVATPPEFKGHEGLWSPEDMMVACVETCIMLTFLYFAERAGVELKEYESEGEGQLQVAPDGMAFTSFIVRASIVVAAPGQKEAAEEAMRRTEDACLVTRSLGADVEVQVELEVSAGEV